MKPLMRASPWTLLISVVKDMVRQAGVSRTSQATDLQVASVQLILEVGEQNGGRGVDFRVPFHRHQAQSRAKVTKKDSHTIDLTPWTARRAGHPPGPWRGRWGSPRERDRRDPRRNDQGWDRSDTCPWAFRPWRSSSTVLPITVYGRFENPAELLS
jgi:hypothetical protein